MSKQEHRWSVTDHPVFTVHVVLLFVGERHLVDDVRPAATCLCRYALERGPPLACPAFDPVWKGWSGGPNVIPYAVGPLAEALAEFARFGVEQLPVGLLHAPF